VDDVVEIALVFAVASAQVPKGTTARG